MATFHFNYQPKVGASSVSNILSAARKLSQQGQVASAQEKLTAGLKQYPKNETLLFEQAQLCLAQQQWQEAATWLTRVIDVAPNKAVYHKTLGDAYAETNDYAPAQAAYETAIRCDENYFNPHANLGNLLLADKKIDDAIIAYQNALRLRPDIAELHDAIGMALREKGQTSAARSAFLEAIKLKPELASAHVNLAGNLASGGHREAAARHYDLALKHQPTLFQAQNGLAYMLLEDGKVDEAKKHLAQMRGNLAQDTALREAEVTFLTGMLALKEGRMHDGETVLLAQGENDSLDILRRRRAYASVALHYDEIGEYQKAFETIQLAHALHKNAEPFNDADAQANYLQRKNAVANAKEMATLSKASNGLKQPIFILGMPRAGKTIADKMLSLHPDVYGLDELLSVNHVIDAHRSARHEEAAENALTEAALNEISQNFIEMAEEYLQDAQQSFHNGIKRIISTTPGNVWHIPLLHRLFPQAHMVYVKRDSRDVGVHCFFKEFGSDFFAFTDNLETLGKQSRRYEAMILHCRDELGIPMLEMTYEEMVRTPLQSCNKLLHYVGLEPLDELNKHRLPTLALTDKYIGHWQHYAPFLSPLIQALESAE